MSDHSRRSTHSLDATALHEALDVERMARGLSWRALADQVGIEPIALTRLGRGRLVDAHSLVSLLAWLEPGVVLTGAGDIRRYTIVRTIEEEPET